MIGIPDQYSKDQQSKSCLTMSMRGDRQLTLPYEKASGIQGLVPA